MLKALLVVAALCIACRWAFGGWPWDYLKVAPAGREATVRARRLLGVAEGAGREEIVAAHRRMTATVHPDRGGSTAAMQEANAARDLLLAALPSDAIGSSNGEPPPPPPSSQD